MGERLAEIPKQKQSLLTEMVDRLSQIAGIAAVVLGGSYASGTQHAASDLDIGLYYFEANPFAIDAIRHAAETFSNASRPTVTGFYEWGAWVNGGAWIHTNQGKIDFLYRNIDQVQRTIDEAHRGIIHHDYDQQPAHGFYSVIYLAETQICIPLYDPDQLLAKLKEQVRVYPPKLKQQIITDSLWGAEFTLLHARSFAEQGDIYNTVGCLSRAAANLTQALFALNEQYFMRDKRVMQILSSFRLLPHGYATRLNQVLASPGSTAQELRKSVDQLAEVWQGVVSLPAVQYAARFQI